MKTLKKIALGITAVAFAFALTACAPKCAGTYEGKADFTPQFMEGLGGDYEVEGKIECDITLELGKDGKYTVSASADSMKDSCSEFLDKNLESIYKQMFNEMGLATDADIEAALAASPYGTMDKMVEDGKAEALKSFDGDDFHNFDSTGKYKVDGDSIEFENDSDMSATIKDDGSIKLVIESDGTKFEIDLKAAK